MSRRSAATLVEVLVAIFVMGIGLIALLTLFPIGIISMSLAIQDERCYQCATMASALANAIDLRHDSWVVQDRGLSAPLVNPALGIYYPTGNVGGTDPKEVNDAYTNPNPDPPPPLGNSSPYPPFPYLPYAEANGSSYPLFVDPVGYYTAITNNWVGPNKGVLARRRVSFTRLGNPPSGTEFNPVPDPIAMGAPSPPYAPGTVIPNSSPIYPQGWPTKQLGLPQIPAYPQPCPYPPPPPAGTSQSLLNESMMSSMFTLTDDLVFNTTLDVSNPGTTILPGTAALANPANLNTLLRDTRFSWAYLCQRPANGSTEVVNLTVVVFNKRPLALGGGFVSLPEYPYNYDPCNPVRPDAKTPPKSPSLSNTTYFDPVNNMITIDYTTNVPPPLRPGDWILDVTQACTRSVDPINPSNLTETLIPPWKPRGTWTPHGYFYRVVSFNEFQDTIAGLPRTLAQYEVTPRLRGFTITDKTGNIVPVFPVYAPPSSVPKAFGGGDWTVANGWPIVSPEPTPVATGNNVNLGYAGSSVVFDGVVRVFEVGAGRNR